MIVKVKSMAKTQHTNKKHKKNFFLFKWFNFILIFVTVFGDYYFLYNMKS